jgi:hypothetical protein
MVLLVDWCKARGTGGNLATTAVLVVMDRTEGMSLDPK